MATTHLMRELADRCMSATKAVEELNALIWCAAFAPKTAAVEQSPYNGAWCIYDGVSSRTGQPRLWEARNSRVQPVTASVDAALLLLPSDWWLYRAGEDRTETRFVGEQHDPKGTFSASLQHVAGGRLREAMARTLPLALCAAACLARCPS